MARYIFLKTSAYRPADLVCALSFCFKCRLDLLTVHGASGGIGMSLWRMMNKWGVPPLHLHSLLYTYAKRLADKNRYLPEVLAGAHVPRRPGRADARCGPDCGSPLHHGGGRRASGGNPRQLAPANQTVPRRRIRLRPDHIAIASAAGRTGPLVPCQNAPESTVFKGADPRGPRADYRADDERPQAEFICGRSLHA